MNNEDKKNLLGVLTKFDWIWGRVRIPDSKYVLQNLCHFSDLGGDKWISEKEKNLLAQNHINIPKICMFFDQKCETTMYFLEIAYF